MEAALFTLDIVFLIVLLVMVRRGENNPDKAGRSLGLFSFLENKTDEVQKGLGRKKGRARA